MTVDSDDRYDYLNRIEEDADHLFPGTPPMHFDYDGNPIKMSQWAKLTEGKYTGEDKTWRIAETQVGPLWVSTVWIGLDMGYGMAGSGQPPIIYETMIFFHADTEVDGEELKIKTWDEEYMDRYATRAAAQAGHERAVEWAKDWMKGKLPDDSGL
jgi:hypothetical protein